MDLNIINTNNDVDLTHGGTNAIETAPIQNINKIVTNDEGSKNNSNNIQNVINTLDAKNIKNINVNEECSSAIYNDNNKENFGSNQLYIEDSDSENEGTKRGCRNLGKSGESTNIVRDVGYKDDYSKNNENMNTNNEIERIDFVKNNNNPNYVLLDNKEFRNLHESTKIDSSVIKPCLQIVPRDTQRLAQTNIHSDPVTTALHHRIGFKELQSNPFSDLINPQVISGNTTNAIEIDKCKTEYVKRYTYSASKVDVCTKQTPEYSVQLIRKVKMDLDVTAIVSRKINSFQNNKSGNEGEHIDKEELNNMRRPNYENGYQYVTRDPDNMIPNNNEENFPVATLSQSINSLVENAVNLPLQVIDANTDLASEDNEIKYFKNNNNDEMVIPAIREELEENQNIHRNEDIPENDEQEEIRKDPVKKDNGIKNILQKYKKILEKNTVKPATPNCSSINTTFKRHISPTKKSAKPFKITDIHKLHATIPDTIVEHKSNGHNDIPQIRKNINFNEMRNKTEDYNSIPQHSYTAEVEPIEEIPENESSHDLDIEPINLPDTVDLEPSNDFKLDQSMLDPKTLLQYVADDDGDEIVPPPAEFCDGVTFSPDYGTLEASMDEHADETFQIDTKERFCSDILDT
uniref:Uncharacterized protein n=1 Tax=Heliothis virescens TaxID=7102 RepID=A0A2A4J663_HELVI